MFVDIGSKSRSSKSREELVSNICLFSSLLRGVQYNLEILVGTTCHETVDCGVDSMHGCRLAVGIGAMYTTDGILGFCHVLRAISSITGDNAAMLPMVEKAARLSNVAGVPQLASSHEMETHDRVYLLGYGWNTCSVGVGLLGGPRPGCRGVGCPRIVCTHYTKSNHHGTNSGKLLLRAVHGTAETTTDVSRSWHTVLLFLTIVQLALASCREKVPFSFGSAVAIRMGVTLPTAVRRTQAIALATSIFSIVGFGLGSVVAYVSSDWIIAIFTTDDEVKELSHAIWFKVCLFNFIVAQFDVLWGIATGLGKQWSLGIINFAFLWIFGLPAICYAAVVCGGGLDAVWTWINIPYLGMNSCLIVLFWFADWDKIQEKINGRDPVDVDPSTELEKVVDEVTHLL